jgi:PAS domain S-box-containing protein
VKNGNGHSNGRFRRFAEGVLVTAGTAALVEILRRAGTPFPNPPAALLLAVVWAAFRGGLGPGLAAAAVAWASFAWFFSKPGRPFEYTEPDFQRVLIWAVAAPAIAALVGILHARAERRGREALRASREQYRDLVELAPEGIFIQADGRFVYANEAIARILGVARPQDLLGREVLDFIRKDYRDLVRERIRRLREEKQAVPLVAQVWLRADGTFVDVEVVAAPVDWEGRPGAQVFVRDVSGRLAAERARRTLEEQLRHAQKMEAVGRLAGGVAHDFNNVLTVIHGYAQTALERLPPEDPLRRDLQEVLRAAERAASLTRQLLAFSRKSPPAPTRLDLNAVLAGMEKFLRRLIGSDIEIVLRPAADLGPVKADRGQLEQVVMNLALNARDAMPKGGTLMLETARVELAAEAAERHLGLSPGPHVVLSISDTGTGMDRETLSRIFEPFFTTKPEGAGTGLGLSIVWAIVREAGGGVWVYSEPGRGTTFKIYLPEAPADEAEAETEAAGGPAGALPRGTETVLVAEDERSIRRLIRELLTALGYQVLEAADGNEALRVSREYDKPIHLLLTDSVMPFMSGRDLARQLAETRPEIRILYMSGYTAPALAANGHGVAAADFLEKPFTPSTLARKVREVLDRPTAGRR